MRATVESDAPYLPEDRAVLISRLTAALDAEVFER